MFFKQNAYRLTIRLENLFYMFQNFRAWPVCLLVLQRRPEHSLGTHQTRTKGARHQVLLRAGQPPQTGFPPNSCKTGSHSRTNKCRGFFQSSINNGIQYIVEKCANRWRGCGGLFEGKVDEI